MRLEGLLVISIQIIFRKIKLSHLGKLCHHLIRLIFILFDRPVYKQVWLPHESESFDSKTNTIHIMATVSDGKFFHFSKYSFMHTENVNSRIKMIVLVENGFMVTVV